jgi:hypothetical protein
MSAFYVLSEVANNKSRTIDVFYDKQAAVMTLNSIVLPMDNITLYLEEFVKQGCVCIMSRYSGRIQQ